MCVCVTKQMRPFVCVRNIYLTSALSLIFALKYANRRKWNGKLESHFPPVALHQLTIFQVVNTDFPSIRSTLKYAIHSPAGKLFQLNLIQDKKNTLFTYVARTLSLKNCRFLVQILEMTSSRRLRVLTRYEC